MANETGLAQIHALFAYNEWANNHVLEAASALSEEELTRELGASFGSVQQNLLHVLWAQAGWLGRFTDSAPVEPPALEAGKVLDLLRQAYQTSHEGLRAFAESLREDSLGRRLSYTDTRGVDQKPLLWQAMLHLVNHGTHHRAETALLLTSLGEPPRQLDFVFFEIERAGGAPRLE